MQSTAEPSTTTATSKPKVHPAAALFPMMDAATFEALKADIEANGQREPVVFFQDKILDGRNRHRACEALGIEPESCELEECIDPVAYVLSANLHRRHLSESQKALVAARLKDYFATKAKERQKQSPSKAGKASGAARRGESNAVENLPPPSENGKARDQAGAMLGVSGKSVDHAVTVLTRGSKNLIEAVERGDVAVSKAAFVAKTKRRDSQYGAAISRGWRAVPAKPLDRIKSLWETLNTQDRAAFIQWVTG